MALTWNCIAAPPFGIFGCDLAAYLGIQKKAKHKSQYILRVGEIRRFFFLGGAHLADEELFRIGDGVEVIRKSKMEMGVWWK